MNKLTALSVLAFMAGMLASHGQGQGGQGQVLHYQRMDTRRVAITCTNGGDPTGVMAENETLIIDCGKDDDEDEGIADGIADTVSDLWDDVMDWDAGDWLVDELGLGYYVDFLEVRQ